MGKALTKTEQKLLAAVDRNGTVHFQTYFARHRLVGSRELSAAERLVKRGLLREGQPKAGRTYVRYSMGYRQVSWTDHFFHRV